MNRPNLPIKAEYSQAVIKVQHYIGQNLAGDVSLETIAQIANYSPFHFQKIFSEVVSETPKQYVIRLRLERAAHHLKVFPDLPVLEIAMGCGFSSPSIFSRAFKNYYQVSAEEFREMSQEDISAIAMPEIKKQNNSQSNADLWTSQINNPLDRLPEIHITPAPVVKSFNAMKIACIQTTLSFPDNISFAFKSLIQWAIPRDLVTPDTRYIGIWLDVPFYTSADKCRYIVGIELKENIRTRNGIDILTIGDGRYANFQMAGDLETVMFRLLALNHKYLDNMGYEVSDLVCYEIFEECPASKPYESIHRNILVPVKHKR